MSFTHQFAQEVEAAADAETNVVSFRDARASRIRELMQEWAQNTFSLGQELLAVRDSFPLVSPAPGMLGGLRRVGWSEWIEGVGISRRHADTLIRIYEMFGQDGGGAAFISASFRLLEYLSRETVPDEVREEVISRVKDGETISKEKAERIVKEHNRPKPAEARKIARETGTPTEASDGNIYFGASKEEEQRIEARRDRVFAIRHAVTALATISMTPEQFLADTPAHLLWTRVEEEQLSQAAEWLMDLLTAWESRR